MKAYYNYCVLLDDGTIGYTNSVPNHSEIFLVIYYDENGNKLEKQGYIVEILEIPEF